MKSRRLPLILCVCLLVFVAVLTIGCNEGATQLTPDELQAVISDVVDAQTRFGLALYQQLASTADDESVFISPFSVHTALSMAYNGAKGSTERDMAHGMFLGDLSRDHLNQAVRALVEAFDDEELGARLDIANGLWYQHGVTFSPGYMQRIADSYRAMVAALNFQDPASANVVNQWVSDRTNGLIPNLIEQLDPETVMLLVNAVYFKGAWSDPFDPNLTQPRPFYLASGQAKSVPMMYKDGGIDHYQGENFQAIRLPYGDEKRLAMYVFLPFEGVELATFTESLTFENWQSWMAGFRSKQGQVWLPRMDVEYKQQLNRVLQAMGMGVAFSPQEADFGDIRPGTQGQNLYISEVNHQAVLKVNEEGTEAAAATSIGFRVTSLPMYEFNFVADRPFLMAIRDEVTGSILFIGSIMDPGTGGGR